MENMRKDFKILGKYKGIEILYEYESLQSRPVYVSFISKGKTFKPYGFSLNNYKAIAIPNILEKIPDYYISNVKVRLNIVIDVIEDVGKISGPYLDISIYKKIIDKIYERKNNTITNF